MQSIVSVYGAILFMMYIFLHSRRTSCCPFSHQQWLSWRSKWQWLDWRHGLSFHRIQSAHSMRSRMKTTHQSMPVVRLNHSLVAMCSLMMEGHVWWLQWIHCWCWTALCGFPPRCSAPPWATGSHSLRLGLNWPCCPTQSWLPWGSAACCSEMWIVTSSFVLWSH